MTSGHTEWTRIIHHVKLVPTNIVECAAVRVDMVSMVKGHDINEQA